MRHLKRRERFVRFHKVFVSNSEPIQRSKGTCCFSASSISISGAHFACSAALKWEKSMSSLFVNVQSWRDCTNKYVNLHQLQIKCSERCLPPDQKNLSFEMTFFRDQEIKIFFDWLSSRRLGVHGRKWILPKPTASPGSKYTYLPDFSLKARN